MTTEVITMIGGNKPVEVRVGNGAPFVMHPGTWVRHTISGEQQLTISEQPGAGFLPPGHLQYILDNQEVLHKDRVRQLTVAEAVLQDTQRELEARDSQLPIAP